MIDCPICGRQGETSREDVLPRWLLAGYEGKRDSKGRSLEGPWTIAYGGSRVFTSEQMERVHLVVCQPCNGWLNRTFELPAKQPIRRVLGGEAIEGEDLVAVARWAIKTILLYGHPKTVFTQTDHLEQRETVIRQRFSGLDGLLQGLRETGRYPDDVSLWAWLRSDASQTDHLGYVEPVVLPRILGEPDAGGPQGRVLGLGFWDDSGRSLQFLLALHPRIDLENPYEGSAVLRLWPAAAGALDPDMIHHLGKNDSKRAGSWFVPGGAAVALRDGERWGDGHVSR